MFVDGQYISIENNTKLTTLVVKRMVVVVRENTGLFFQRVNEEAIQYLICYLLSNKFDEVKSRTLCLSIADHASDSFDVPVSIALLNKKFGCVSSSGDMLSDIEYLVGNSIKEFFKLEKKLKRNALSEFTSGWDYTLEEIYLSDVDAFSILLSQSILKTMMLSDNQSLPETFILACQEGLIDVLDRLWLEEGCHAKCLKALSIHVKKDKTVHPEVLGWLHMNLSIVQLNEFQRALNKHYLQQFRKLPFYGYEQLCIAATDSSKRDTILKAIIASVFVHGHIGILALVSKQFTYTEISRMIATASKYALTQGTIFHMAAKLSDTAGLEWLSRYAGIAKFQLLYDALEGAIDDDNEEIIEWLLPEIRNCIAQGAIHFKGIVNEYVGGKRVTVEGEKNRHFRLPTGAAYILGIHQANPNKLEATLQCLNEMVQEAKKVKAPSCPGFFPRNPQIQQFYDWVASLEPLIDTLCQKENISKLSYL